MNKKFLILSFCLLFFSLVSGIVVVNEDSLNLQGVEINPPIIIPFDNNTGIVNGSNFSEFTDIWLTDQGPKDNVPDITLADFGSLFVDTDLNLNGFDIRTTGNGRFDNVTVDSLNNANTGIVFSNENRLVVNAGLVTTGGGTGLTASETIKADTFAITAGADHTIYSDGASLAIKAGSVSTNIKFQFDDGLGALEFIIDADNNRLDLESGSLIMGGDTTLTEGDVLINSDTGKLLVGESGDVSFTFDGSNAIFLAEVGTPNINFSGFKNFIINNAFNISVDGSNNVFMTMQNPSTDFTIKGFEGAVLRDVIKWDTAGFLATPKSLRMGTANPVMLVMAGGTTSGGASLRARLSASDSTRKLTVNANPLIFQVASTDKLTLTSTEATLDQDLFINGDLIQAGGNATYNGLYGEVWFNNNSASGRTTVINTIDIWENVTGFDQTGDNGGSTLNGFTVNNDNSLDSLFSGRYIISYSVSFERVSGGAAREYNVAIAINGVIQNKSEIHRTIGNVNDVGAASHNGFHQLSPDDMIHLMVRNTGGTEDAGFHNANLNIIRIGN